MGGQDGIRTLEEKSTVQKGLGYPGQASKKHQTDAPIHEVCEYGNLKKKIKRTKDHEKKLLDLT